MIAQSYSILLGIGAIFWCALIWLSIAFIDPYGISPLDIRIARFNEFKPYRVNIDRVIKPYEVWRYKPRTLFLGTSRIQQSVDPALLDGTEYAPAYNASIPANFMGENAAYIDHYFEINKNLKYVFAELFLYNFIFPAVNLPPMSMMSMAKDVYPLQFSGTAIADSMQTLLVNRSGKLVGPVIDRRGHWLPPAGRGMGIQADPFIAEIMRIHKSIPDLSIQSSVFQALDRIQAACERHGAKLILVMTPNFPYDDYRILSLGYWNLLEDWYRKIASYPNVVSFSQYNQIVSEQASDQMKYWYDTMHFSEHTATLAIKAFLGRSDPEIPSNMMVWITPENVEKVIQDRRQGLGEWMKRNSEFVEKFEAAKFASGNDEATRIWRRENPALAAKQAAEEAERRKSRDSNRVRESLKDLDKLEAEVGREYPAATIKDYQIVTANLVKSSAVVREMSRTGALANLWDGRILVQIFPANAMGAGKGAAHNFVYEAVPKEDCAQFVAGLSRRDGSSVFRINIEPSGKIHEKFPITGDDGCVSGANSIGYTVIAN